MANATGRGRVIEGMRSSWTGSETWTGGGTLSSGRSDEGLALAVQQREEGAYERLVKAFDTEEKIGNR